MATTVHYKTLSKIALGICVILALGCASFPHKEKTDDFLYRAGDIIKKRCEYWKTFEAQISVKARSYKDSSRYLLSCYRDHDFIRFDLTSVWGNTISVVVIKPNESLMWIPAQKTVYRSASPGGFLKKIAGIDGQITDVLNLLTGCFLESREKNVEILSATNSLFVVSGLKINLEDSSWEVLYSPYFPLFPLDSTPKMIQIRVPYSEMYLDVQKMEKRVAIPQNMFNLSYPAETSVLEL